VADENNESQLGAWDSAWGFGIRVLLVAVGTIGVINGIVVATQTKAATPLLAAGIGLLALALLLHLNPAQIALNWKEFSLVFRDFQRGLTKLANETDPDEQQKLISALQANIEALNDRLREVGGTEPSRQIRRRSERSLEFWRRRPRAAIALAPNDQLSLRVTVQGGQVERVTCLVTGPDAQTIRNHQSTYVDAADTVTFVFLFPADFPREGPWPEGTYKAEMRVTYPNGRTERLATITFLYPVNPESDAVGNVDYYSRDED
jgi:hypothetical protein